MDERFRGKKHWIVLGAVAIIFLCLIMCGLGTMAMVVMRSGPAHGVTLQLQSPAGEEGIAPPAVYPGLADMGGFSHRAPFGFFFGGLRLLFGLAFFGLFLLLIVGLIWLVCWGPRRWGPPPWPRPPAGQEGRPHAGWGPWAWHHHSGPGGPGSEPAGEEGEQGAAGTESGGPQE
jgi:uncharacterized membrane protein YhaH (DUF805 family)